MKKKIIAILFCIILSVPSCAPSKPSWERKPAPEPEEPKERPGININIDGDDW
jgi:hypothetical protein